MTDGHPWIFFNKETISTCRFSQRVALIKNDAILNEELDPRLLINQLRTENLQLRNQIAMQSGTEQFNDPLTPEMMAKSVMSVSFQCTDCVFTDWLNKYECI